MPSNLTDVENLTGSLSETPELVAQLSQPFLGIGADGQNGQDGEDGRGIVSILKTDTNGNVDTYTITYSDSTTSTFTVTNGTNGTNGINGNQGINGIDGSNGKDGSDGINGLDGETPNISIGTVSTLDAGTSATASITGTTPNLTLNLGIPKGTDGQDGTSDISAENKAKLENISDEFVVNIIYDPTVANENPDYHFSVNHTAAEILDAYYNQHKRIIGTYLDTPDAPTQDIFPLTPLYMHEPSDSPLDVGQLPYVYMYGGSYRQGFFFSIDDFEDGTKVYRNYIGYQDVQNKTSTIDSSSDEGQYPSAKATYEAIEEAKLDSYSYVEGESDCGKYMGKTLYRYCYTKPTATDIETNTDFDIGLDATNVDKVIALGATGGNGNILHGGKLNNRIVVNSVISSTVRYIEDTTFWVEYTKITE